MNFLPAEESAARAMSKAFVTDWNKFIREVSPKINKMLYNYQVN